MTQAAQVHAEHRYPPRPDQLHGAQHRSVTAQADGELNVISTSQSVARLALSDLDHVAAVLLPPLSGRRRQPPCSRSLGMDDENYGGHTAILAVAVLNRHPRATAGPVSSWWAGPSLTERPSWPTRTSWPKRPS